MKETVLAAALALSLGSPSAFAAETADVVVVGAGAAGLSASIGAAARGAKVILLEKTTDAGGNTAFAKLGLNAAATPDLAAARITGDSPTLFAADTIRYGHQINDAALVRAMTVTSAPALAWLETLGAKLCLRITPVGSEERPRLMAPCDGTAVGPRLIQVLKAKALQSQVDLRTQARATKLILADQKVSGIEVQTPKGRYQIKAKAVVLATGGFAAYSALVNQVHQSLKGIAPVGFRGATGDGLVIARAAGALLLDLDQLEIRPTVSVKGNVPIEEALRARGGILLNKSGKRFTDETGIRDIVSQDILKQSGHSAYLVIDSEIFDADKALQTYVDQGLMKRCGTVAAVAKAIGANSAAVKSTLNRYYRAYDRKFDQDFARYEMRVRLDQGPWYVAAVKPGVLATLGGIKINDRAEVLGSGDTPIPGLYAAGEVTAGVQGGNMMPGNGLTDAVTFGLIAGAKSAAYVGKTGL